jgi:malate dehydrogenase (oxaloacetate-decarboxylating)(NADP+)
MPESTLNTEEKRAQLRRAALEYHELPTPGKIAIAATKQLVNQRDLALAYSPGVAAPCEEIVKDPNNAFKYTSRGNLVAVITNRAVGPPGSGHRRPALSAPRQRSA